MHVHPAVGDRRPLADVAETVAVGQAIVVTRPLDVVARFVPIMVEQRLQIGQPDAAVTVEVADLLRLDR